MRLWFQFIFALLAASACGYAPGPKFIFKYDAAGRLTNMVDAAGVTAFAYSEAGQLIREDGPWANDTVTNGYVARQRRSLALEQPSASPWINSYAYDAARRLTSVSSQAGAFDYVYDALRKTQISKLALPGGSYITNNYDSMGRLLGTLLRNSGGMTLNSHAYAYNLGHERTRQTFKDGNYMDYTYDNIGQLKTAFGKESGGTSRLQELLSFAYDAAGNLNYRTNNAFMQAFTINSLNELSNATRSGTLTVAGNTTTTATNVTVNTTNAAHYADLTWAGTNFTLADGNNTFTVIADNPYGWRVTNSLTVNLPATNAFVYDLNGNLRTNGTRIYEYDDENQLVTNWVAAAWKSEFVYDGLSRRRIARDYTWQTGQWVKTNETRYVYDGLLTIQERNSNNVPQVTYTRGPDLSGTLQGAGGIGGLLARTDASGSAFYHADGSGNITALININQLIVAIYLYDPFGNILAMSGPLADANVMRFSSMPFFDKAEIVGYWGRFYDPTLQRWLTQDPIGEAGGVNRYQFNYNNPLRYVDPDGLAPQMVGFSYDLNSGAVSPQYVDQKFGQDYGIGLHGPAGAGGEAVLTLGASMVPPIGELMDLSVLRDPDSRWWEKTLAGASLGANMLTDGFLPNAGGFIKGGKKLCKPGRITGDALDKMRKEFNAMKPKAWMEEAAKNPHKYTPEQLANMRRGEAPIGTDGFSMEIHHKKPLTEGGINARDNFDFLTRSDHRVGANYKLNHPNLP